MSQSLPSRAVIEQRAPAVIEEEDPERAKWRSLDWYATAPWGARAGAEIIKTELDQSAEFAWEPACGDGIMAHCLGEYFTAVAATDVYPQGFGQQADFLTTTYRPNHPVHWVISNPPYALAEEFIRKGLEIAERGVAMLCRLAFLEGDGRYALHYGAPNPLTLCAPFAERCAMKLGPWLPTHSSMTAYAWFFYQKGAAPRPLRGIPPGTRDRLWKTDDVRRFVKENQGTLL